MKLEVCKELMLECVLRLFKQVFESVRNLISFIEHYVLALGSVTLTHFQGYSICFKQNL